MNDQAAWNQFELDAEREANAAFHEAGRTTRTPEYTVEQISSETVAIMRDGFDILHMRTLDECPATDDEFEWFADALKIRANTLTNRAARGR